MAGDAKKRLANRLLELAGTVDGIKEEDYADDATELFDHEDAIDLREAAAILKTAVTTPDLRDYFAGKAVQGAEIYVKPGHVPTEEEITNATARIAKVAYRLADAMLAERAKGGGQ